MCKGMRVSRSGADKVLIRLTAWESRMVINHAKLQVSADPCCVCILAAGAVALACSALAFPKHAHAHGWAVKSSAMQGRMES